MSKELGIKRCWFHNKRIEEITKQCTVVSSKEIMKIINERRNGRRTKI